MEQQHKKTTYISQVFNYQWIVTNVPFFLYVALLAIVYIANGHYADKTVRDINQTAKEIKQLQNEYKTLKSELMFKSREAELIKAAAPLGLQIPTEPTQRIPLQKN